MKIVQNKMTLLSTSAHYDVQIRVQIPKESLRITTISREYKHPRTVLVMSDKYDTLPNRIRHILLIRRLSLIGWERN